MRLPGMGFTSASWTAYSTQNAVRPWNSPGSNHTGDSVTYNAQRISPSGLGWEVGLGWAAASPKALTARYAHSQPAVTITDHRGNLRAGFISPPRLGFRPFALESNQPGEAVHSSGEPTFPDPPRRDRGQRPPDRPASRHPALSARRDAGGAAGAPPRARRRRADRVE